MIRLKIVVHFILPTSHLIPLQEWDEQAVYKKSHHIQVRYSNHGSTPPSSVTCYIVGSYLVDMDMYDVPQEPFRLT